MVSEHTPIQPLNYLLELAPFGLIESPLPTLWYPMKLLIRNLSRSTTESEVRGLFESYGKVQSCNLVMDAVTGKSKGFGFVEMPNNGEGKAAMKNLNGMELSGCNIRVKRAEEKLD